MGLLVGNRRSDRELPCFDRDLLTLLTLVFVQVEAVLSTTTNVSSALQELKIQISLLASGDVLNSSTSSSSSSSSSTSSPHTGALKLVRSFFQTISIPRIFTQRVFFRALMSAPKLARGLDKFIKCVACNHFFDCGA